MDEQAAAPPRTEPRVLIPAEEIQRRLAEMAARIDERYADCDRLLCVGVLKGSMFFLVDLVRRLSVPVEVDFVQISSYRDGATRGEAELRKNLDLPTDGRDVLLVEDIVDSGHSVRALLAAMPLASARSVAVCTMLDKACRREVDVPIAFRGFEIEDRFVVGYGLDIDERYRELPYVGYFPQEDSE
ncbi:MAG: hypoxanthine phosphoribosyltransferase [Thermoanaerobaculia bacterium]